MGRVRDDHLGPGRALGVVPRPHEQEAGELPGGAGRRLQCRGRHPGDGAEGLLELNQQAEPTLGQRCRRSRVHTGQAGQGGDGVAHLGVVLHGAGAEWVGTEVDRVLPVGQPGEVGHEIAFGHLDEAERLGAPVSLRNDLFDVHLGDPGRAQGVGGTPGL